MSLQNFEKLMEIRKKFPELTFDNNGYQYISIEIRERHSIQIKEIKQRIETLGRCL